MAKFNRNTAPAPVPAPPTLNLTGTWQASTVIQADSDAALRSVSSDDRERIYQTAGQTVIVKTDKEVYVNTYEQVTEQKYITTGGGSGTPAGSNSQLQFNNSGTFGASSGLTWNTGTNTLTAVNLNVSGNSSLGAVGNVSITGGSSGQLLCTDGSGGLSWATVSGSVNLDAYCSLAIGGGLTSSTGYNNFAIGYEALNSNTTGQNNVAIGYLAGNCNTTGEDNISIGSYSLTSNTYGYGNIAIGRNALTSNTYGYGNISIGKNTGCSISNATSNTAIGLNALVCNTTGNFNVAIGNESLYCNLQGFNTGIGTYSLRENTLGCLNTALGFGSLYGNTSGNCNVAIGPNSLACTTYGNNNAALGVISLKQNTTGSYNLGIGNCSLYGNIIGNCNIAIGVNSLLASVSGNNNISIGINSGCCIVTGNNNTIIGSLPGSAGVQCTVLIGAGTCERVKVDNTGLCINGGSLFTNNGSAIYIKNTYEAIVPLSGATGVVTHDFSQGSIFNHTSIANNFTANFTNLNLTAGNATNAVLILNQGGTAYLPTAVQIGGVAQTINWQGGSPPTGNASQKDIVSFSITNISSTYTVFGQLVTFA